ncbi:RegF [Neisseria meningitidis]|nr:RegF [Neisseria meningitidis]
MMTLYSGITCPFSQRCRFVLYEKGMDFEIKDVDVFNKPEDLALMNPYNQVPVLVERDLILHESNIINEYIDERFPHPQLMPGDPVMRGGLRQRLEQEFIFAVRSEDGNVTRFQHFDHAARVIEMAVRQSDCREREFAVCQRLQQERHVAADIGQDGFAAFVVPNQGAVLAEGGNGEDFVT